MKHHHHHHHHVRLIAAMIKEYVTCEKVVLDGAHLTLAQIARIGRPPKKAIAVELNAGLCRARVEGSRSWVDAAVERADDIYGITTGFGACCDQRTLQVQALQEELLRFLMAGMFVPAPGGESGEQQPIATTRAAIAARLNGLLRGLSGIRWRVLEALAQLLNAGVTPRCPLRGTVTASGDLIPLAYIAGLLVGWPTVQAHVPGGGGTRLVGSREALAIAGVQEPITLGAKEGLALVNGTSFAAAEAGLVLLDLHVLFLLSELCSALFCEVIHAKPDFTDPLLHEAKHHRGQIEVAAALRWLLRGSPLIRRGEQIYGHQASKRGRQDRYAVRCIPHWLGPQLEAIQSATVHIENELKYSANDNPLVDLANDRALHGANFQGSYIGFPMDSVRIAVAAVAKLLFAQFTELMLEMSSNGLTGNLALGPNFALDFGLKGVDVGMAAYLSEILHLANPVTVHCQSAEQHNQDINSLGLISARRTTEAAHILKMMLASCMVALCQAVDLRHLEDCFHAEVVGAVRAAGEECELDAWLVEELAGSVEKMSALSYAHDAANPSLPLMASLNTTLLQYIACNTSSSSNNNNNNSSVHAGQHCSIDERVRRSKAFQLKLERELGQKLLDAQDAFLAQQYCRPSIIKRTTMDRQTMISPARRAVAQYTTAGPRHESMDIQGSKTFPLYRFVRHDLDTRILTGIEKGRRSPDIDLQRVLDAITDGRIVEPMLQCFQGFNDDHAVTSSYTSTN